MSGLVPGLQNQLERFDSASDLQQRTVDFPRNQLFFFIFPNIIKTGAKPDWLRPLYDALKKSCQNLRTITF